MSWNKVYRVLAAEHRRQEHARMAARVGREVAAHQQLVDGLVSLHKGCAPDMDWEALVDCRPPLTPLDPVSERLARRALSEYEPSFFDRLFGWTDRRIAALNRAVDEAVLRDQRERKTALAAHAAEVQAWENDRAFALRVLDYDPRALADAIAQVEPFVDLAEIGAKVEVAFSPSGTAQAAVQFRDFDVVPSVERRQLKSGKLSEKPVSATRRHEVGRELVASACLRVVRDLFAVLPLDRVVASACTVMPDPETARREWRWIVSVAVHRQALHSVDLQRLTASEALERFTHRETFKSRSGFQPIEPIRAADLGW